MCPRHACVISAAEDGSADPRCPRCSRDGSVQGAENYFLSLPNVTKGQVQVYFVCFLADVGMMVWSVQPSVPAVSYAIFPSLPTYTGRNAFTKTQIVSALPGISPHSWNWGDPVPADLTKPFTEAETEPESFTLLPQPAGIRPVPYLFFHF